MASQKRLKRIAGLSEPMKHKALLYKRMNRLKSSKDMLAFYK